MYSQTTESIKVSVFPLYLEAESRPQESHYVWAYTVLIENLSETTVQLINRHWHITDGSGQVEQVTGRGVLGEQPVIRPKESVQYASGVHLHTPSGLMYGSYEMQRADGTMFIIAIPPFSLDSIEQMMRPN